MSRVLRLPHDESDPSKQYKMANPDSEELVNAFNRLGQRIKDGFVVHSEVQLMMGLASAYILLTGPETSEEEGVKMLRDIFAARKAREADD